MLDTDHFAVAVFLIESLDFVAPLCRFQCIDSLRRFRQRFRETVIWHRS